MAIINDLSARYANDGAADAAFVAAGWAKSEGVMYYDTTLNQFKRWDAVLSAWVFDAGTISGGTAFPGIETMQALFVDQGTNVAQDGSATSPFHTITAAYAAAKLLAPTVTNQIAIIIMGGTYVETVTMDVGYIHLVGQGTNATLITNSAVAAPTVDINVSALTPGYVRIQDMTIQATWGVNARHALRINSSDAYITDVNLSGVNTSSSVTCLSVSGLQVNAEFNRVQFDGNSGNQHYTADINHATGTLVFMNCMIGAYGIGYFQIHSAPKIRFIGCQFFTNPIHAGNVSSYLRVVTTPNVTNLECIGCYFKHTNFYGIFTEVACTVKVVGCMFDTNSYPLYINRDTVLTVTGCTFSTSAAYDIYSDLPIRVAPAEVFGNRMAKGMLAYIVTKNPIKNVGGDHDFYATLSDAMTSIAAHGAIVKLHTDVTLTAAITPVNYRIEIDGQGMYTITRTGGGGNAAFTLNATQILRLRGLKLVDGSVDLTAAATAVIFEAVDCIFDDAMIDVQAGVEGTLVQLDHCDCFAGDGEKYALQTQDADPTIRIDDCYMIGSIDDGGYPAIYDTATNQNYRIVNSDILGYPGDPGVAPMISTGAPAYVSHHVAYTSAVSGFANVVLTPYDVFNANIGMRRISFP